MEKNSQPESFDFYSMLNLVIFEHLLRIILLVPACPVELRKKIERNQRLTQLHFHPGIIYLPSGKLT